MVNYGTAAYDERSSALQALSAPKWKRSQEADRVRERFHGAFTGGFSAGYFNTVGSKEGWAPSSFYSSRKVKAKVSESKPEDFMDQEDLQQQEESIALVPVDWTPEQHVPTAVAKSKFDTAVERLFQSNISESVLNGINRIGYGLLAKMGWKPGQGIGPRIGRRLVVDDKQVNFEVAPKNTSISILPPESPHHGLGYGIPVRELAPVDDRSTDVVKTKVKKRKLAMNLSIAADYDEDVHRDDELDGLSRLKRQELGSRAQKVAKFKPSKKFHKAVVTSIRRLHDGSAPMDGFVVATRDIYSPGTFDGLHAPEDFIPSARFSTEANLSHVKLEPQHAEIKAEPDLVPEVFPTAEDKLADDDIPFLDPDIALKALNNPRYPYSEDPGKQRRYVDFIRSQTAVDDKTTVPKKDPLLPHDTWIREMHEFCRVAHVFRPLEGDIALRFAAPTAAGQDVAKPLHLVDEDAALRGEYGPLTMRIKEFTPERLLCKRFGVPFTGITKAVEEDTRATPAVAVQETVKLAKPAITIDPDHNKALEAERAPLDLFAQVFGDGEDDEDDD